MNEKFKQKLEKREQRIRDRFEADPEYGEQEHAEIEYEAEQGGDLSAIPPKVFNVGWAHMLEDIPAFHGCGLMPELLSKAELAICQEMCRRHRAGKITDVLLGFPPEEFSVVETVLHIDNVNLVKLVEGYLMQGGDTEPLEDIKAALEDVDPYDYLVWHPDDGVDVSATVMRIAEEVF